MEDKDKVSQIQPPSSAIKKTVSEKIYTDNHPTS